MPKSYLYFIPAVVWGVIIFMLSTNTPVEVGPVDWLDFISIDKVGHLTFYSVFSGLVCWGFHKMTAQSKILTTSQVIFSISIVVMYGIVMEFLQLGFYEGRQMEFMDIIANTIGAILGAILFKKLIVSRL